MQPQQDFSVERRPLEFDDYIDILRRHRAWTIGPTLAGLVISVVVAFLWPDTYVSQAMMKIVPSQIPERFVPSNVNIDLTQRINNMSQTILSRANLTNMISNYNLYPREIKNKPIEDLIEEMRAKHIRIGNVINTATGTKGGAFPISFEYDDRFKAQKVCQELVSRFMNENLRESSQQSTGTTEFLEESVSAAKKELDRISGDLTAFRLHNNNTLPEERMSNLQTLHSFENRMSNVNAQLSRISQDKLLLEADLRRTQDLLTQALTPQSVEMQNPMMVQARNEQLIAIERDVQALETNLTMLKDRYTPLNPEVKRAEQTLALAKRKRDELQKQEDTKKAATTPGSTKRVVIATKEANEYQTRLSNLKAQLAAKELENEEAIKEQKNLNSQMKSYEGRIQSSPIGEQKYLELMRDYDRAKQTYEELSKKRTDSQLAKDVINRKQGETLEMLDPASIPITPTEPKRWVIITVGTIGGFLLGLMLAGAREMKDTSLKNLKDVRTYTQLTILGCIPLLENDLVVRRRRRLSLLAWSTACLLGVAVMSASVYYYYFTKS